MHAMDPNKQCRSMPSERSWGTFIYGGLASILFAYPTIIMLSEAKSEIARTLFKLIFPGPSLIAWKAAHSPPWDYLLPFFIFGEFAIYGAILSFFKCGAHRRLAS